jgi:hypothetical protein
MIASRTRFGALSLLVLLALAACGSGGSVSAVPQSSPATSAEPADSGSAAPPDSVTVDTSFTGEGSEEVCRYARELEESGALSGSDLSKEKFDQFEEAIGKMLDKAPDEIKGDLQKLGDAVSALRPIYEKYDYDEEKIAGAITTDPDITKAFESISAPDIEAAGTRVDAYFEQVCGISPSS